MAHKKFIAALIEIYGDYASEKLEDMTYLYLQERFKESELDNVFKTIIIKVNPKFKTPPSPADFEEFFPRLNMESLASAWYDNICKTGNSLDNVIISDYRAYKALQSMGGWINFCQRATENKGQSLEGIHRNNFISAYCKVIIDPNESIKIMYGDSSKKFEKQPLFIGDKEVCQAIVDNRDKPLQIIDDMTRDMKI